MRKACLGLCFVILIVLLCSCGRKNSSESKTGPTETATSTPKEEIIWRPSTAPTEAVTPSPTDSPGEDTEWYYYEVLHAEEIEADTEWINGIWTQIFDTLYKAGDVTSDNPLSFKLADSGMEKYSENTFSIDGKIICAGNYGYSHDVLMSYFRSFFVDPSMPYYYIDQIAQASSKVSFADNREECQYLFLILGIYSKESGFYEGGAARTSVSTEVIIIDLEAMEVIHIEHIGTDTPSAITSVPTGKIKEYEAMDYIASVIDSSKDGE